MKFICSFSYFKLLTLFIQGKKQKHLICIHYMIKLAVKNNKYNHVNIKCVNEQNFIDPLLTFCDCSKS